MNYTPGEWACIPYHRNCSDSLLLKDALATVRKQQYTAVDFQGQIDLIQREKPRTEGERAFQRDRLLVNFLRLYIMAYNLEHLSVREVELRMIRPHFLFAIIGAIIGLLILIYYSHVVGNTLPTVLRKDAAQFDLSIFLSFLLVHGAIYCYFANFTFFNPGTAFSILLEAGILAAFYSKIETYYTALRSL